MRITPLECLQSLPYMGKGMLGIFVVIGVIYALIAILNATTGKRKKEED